MFKSIMIMISSNMNSGINSPGAAAASCNMKDLPTLPYLTLPNLDLRWAPIAILSDVQ